MYKFNHISNGILDRQLFIIKFYQQILVQLQTLLS